jgi:NAD(P)H-dependent FMN reductase
MPLKLNIVICSTRPGRVGPAIARWFHAAAQAHGGFEAELVDLADFDLPLYNEPHHPRLQNYQHAHTKAWAKSVGSADAFVFVTPEYNGGPPPTFFNALNYVFLEWNYKPAGFVSYAGISGGLRSVQMEKLALTAVKVMPISDNVVIPMFAQQLDAERSTFTPNEVQAKAAPALLTELSRWAKALKTLREEG